MATTIRLFNAENPAPGGASRIRPIAPVDSMPSDAVATRIPSEANEYLEKPVSPLVETLSGIGDWIKGIPEETGKFVDEVKSDPVGFAKGLGQATLGAIRSTPGTLMPELPSTRMAKKARELTGESPIPTETELLTSSPVEAAAAEEFVPVMQGLVGLGGAKAIGPLARGAIGGGKTPAARIGREILSNVIEGQAASAPFSFGAANKGNLQEAGQIAAADAALDVLMGGLGAGAGEIKRTVKAAKQAKQAALPALGSVEDLSKPSQPWKAEQIVRDMNLSEADWRAIDALPAPRTVPLPKYAEASVNFSRNRGQLAPDEVFNMRATEELQGPVREAVKKAGAELGAVIEDNKGTIVDLRGIRDRLKSMASEFVGGELVWRERPRGAGAKQVMVNTPTSLVKDRDGAKVIEAMAELLSPENVPDYSDIKFAHSLKSAIKQFESFRDAGGGIIRSTPAEAVVKQLRRDVDDIIKSTLPLDQATRYVQANEGYRTALNTEKALAGVLGKEVMPGSGMTRHGGQVGKRALQSSAPGDIRIAFDAVKKLTGADLMQDAAYANIVMRMSGDADQVRRALQFGGAMSEEAMREIAGPQGLGKMPVVNELSRLAKAAAKAGRLQRLVDFYTSQHGMQPVKLGIREYVPPPIANKSFAETLADLAGDESGAIGSRPFDAATPQFTDAVLDAAGATK